MISSYISDLIGWREYALREDWQSIFDGLKGVVGDAAKAHHDATRRGLATAPPGIWEGDGSWGLNPGSVVLLIAAASEGNNNWLRSVKWPQGTENGMRFRFIPIAANVSEAELALAFCDDSSLFRIIAVREEIGGDSITSVEVESDRVKVHLSWAFNSNLVTELSRIVNGEICAADRPLRRAALTLFNAMGRHPGCLSFANDATGEHGVITIKSIRPAAADNV